MLKSISTSSSGIVKVNSQYLSVSSSISISSPFIMNIYPTSNALEIFTVTISPTLADEGICSKSQSSSCIVMECFAAFVSCRQPPSEHITITAQIRLNSFFIRTPQIYCVRRRNHPISSCLGYSCLHYTSRKKCG